MLPFDARAEMIRIGVDTVSRTSSCSPDLLAPRHPYDTWVVCCFPEPPGGGRLPRFSISAPAPLPHVRRCCNVKPRRILRGSRPRIQIFSAHGPPCFLLSHSTQRPYSLLGTMPPSLLPPHTHTLPSPHSTAKKMPCPAELLLPLQCVTTKKSTTLRSGLSSLPASLSLWHFCSLSPPARYSRREKRQPPFSAFLTLSY